MVLSGDLFIAGVFLFILGTVIGSFGNVLLLRLPHNERITGRSHCPACMHQLSVADLIPVISFVLLRGQCRYCKARISSLYPAIEIATGVLFVLSLPLGGLYLPHVLLLAIALWLLLLIAVTDYRTHTIPDLLNIPFVLVALVYSLKVGLFDVASPIITAGFFALQWLYSKGRWVGSGDIILAAGIGLLVGFWPYAILSLFLAYVLGAALAAYLLLTKKTTAQTQIAFGPFLAAGALLTLLYGDTIMSTFRLF